MATKYVVECLETKIINYFDSYEAQQSHVKRLVKALTPDHNGAVDLDSIVTYVHITGSSVS